MLFRSSFYNSMAVVVSAAAAGPATNCGNRLYYSVECGIFQGRQPTADRKSPQNTGKRLSVSGIYAILCRRMRGRGRAGCGKRVCLLYASAVSSVSDFVPRSEALPLSCGSASFFGPASRRRKS